MQRRHLTNVLAVAVVATGAIFAQGPFPGGHTPPDPATMIANQVARLTTLLTLTTAQQSQATTIFTNASTATTPVRTNLQTAHTSLTAAVQKNDTASIDNLSAQIGSLTGQEVSIQSKSQATFYAILTADQQVKYNTVHGPGGFGGGPGGFRRGPARQ